MGDMRNDGHSAIYFCTWNRVSQIPKVHAGSQKEGSRDGVGGLKDLSLKNEDASKTSARTLPQNGARKHRPETFFD